MRNEIKRLEHLTNAQGKLGHFLELQIVRMRREIDDLELKRGAIMRSLDGTTSFGLVIYATVIRRLADIDQAMTSCEHAVDQLKRKRLKVKERHKVLLQKLEVMSAALERKVTEAEAQDVALNMKATGKHGVL